MFSSKLAKTKFVLELSICDELMKSTKVQKKGVGGPTLKTKTLGDKIPSRDEIVARGLVKIETSCVNNMISCIICIEVQNSHTSVIIITFR